MTGYVSVAWQRQLRVVPAVGCCGGRHIGSAAELVKPRELVATYRPGGAAAYVPVCEACDRAIFAGELEWAQVTGAEGGTFWLLATPAEIAGGEVMAEDPLEGLPPAIAHLVHFAQAASDGHAPSYLSGWHDALEFVRRSMAPWFWEGRPEVENAFPPAHLLEIMDAAVGDWTDQPAPDEYLAARSELLDRVRAELKV